MIAQYLSTHAQQFSDLSRVHTPESDSSATLLKIFHAKFARVIEVELTQGAVTAFPVAYLIESYVDIAMVFLSYSLKKGLDVAVVLTSNDFTKTIYSEKSENDVNSGGYLDLVNHLLIGLQSEFWEFVRHTR